ncbi:hypothetical protein ACSBR1_012423 [Camellia fascicularis]
MAQIEASSGGGGGKRRGVKYLVDTSPNMTTLPPEYVLPVQPPPASGGDGEIPVIDLSGLDGPIERRRLTVETISSACADWGFFRIFHILETLEAFNDMGMAGNFPQVQREFNE